jgi:subtilisin family serine protease
MFMVNRKIMIALLVLGGVLIVAAGIVFLVSSRDSAPQPELNPPASLDELAELYPDLASILTDPELGSVYKQFLVAYEEGGKDAALELARRRGLLTPDGDVRVNLLLDTEDHTALVAQLEATRVQVISAHKNQIDLAVPIALVEAQLQTEDPGAIFARLTELEHVIAVRLPVQRVGDGSAIDGEGVGVIGANAWHDAGFTGAGLRIGVLDLGFAGYENLLSDELPGGVTVQTFGAVDPNDPEPHGTACAEIIHEIAPEAELFLAWYDGYDTSFGEAVTWLQSQGVDIISHSANGQKGPFDGTAPDCQEVDTLSAQGILWVNSAGNEALSHHRSAFSDEDGDGFHEFAPGEETLALYNGGYVRIVLNWDDDWAQATQDYELYLYDAAGYELAASQDAQTGDYGDEPVEAIYYETGGETVYAAIVAYEVDQAVIFDMFVAGAEVDYPSPDHSVCSPADAVSSLTVGAVNWWDDSLASYSSQGPTADGRLKPEISAPTSVSGASYGSAVSYDEYAGFNGTSAACPHVAGAAALVWQAYPEFGREDVVDFLLSHAIDLGESGPDTGFGYGRLQLPLPEPSSPTPHPTATPPEPPPADSTATPVPPPTPTTTPEPPAFPTPVAFVTPAPVPPSGAGTGLLGISTVGLIMGGLGCAGMALLLCGAVGLLIVSRRARRPRPSTPPLSPAPYPRPAPPPAEAMRCQTCGAAVRPGTRFCTECGHSITAGGQPRACPHCGRQLREGARFCPYCGKTAG